MSGQYESSVSVGGPALPKGTAIGFFLAKYDPSGNWLWSKGFAGASANQSNDLRVDSTGASIYPPYNGSADWFLAGVQP